VRERRATAADSYTTDGAQYSIFFLHNNITLHGRPYLITRITILLLLLLLYRVRRVAAHRTRPPRLPIGRSPPRRWHKKASAPPHPLAGSYRGGACVHDTSDDRRRTTFYCFYTPSYVVAASLQYVRSAATVLDYLSAAVYG